MAENSDLDNLEELLGLNIEDEDLSFLDEILPIEETQDSFDDIKSYDKNVPADMQDIEDDLFGSFKSTHEPDYTKDVLLDEIDNEVEVEEEPSFAESFGLEGDADIFSLDGFDLEAEDFNSESFIDMPIEIDEPAEEEYNLELDLSDYSVEDDNLIEKEDFSSAFENAPGRKKKSKKYPDHQISDEDLEKLLTYLNKFPHNVKIEIEEFLGDEDIKHSDYIDLIGMLVEGKPVKKIVRWLSDTLGRVITIPKGYESMSGADFVKEVETPLYIFKEKYLPLVIKSMVVAMLVGFSIWGVFWNLLPPAKAKRTFDRGYRELKVENYELSEKYFDQACEIYPLRKQFYKFAEGYIEKRQYILAEETYEKLLSIKNYPNDSYGKIEFGMFESKLLGNYNKADTLFESVLEEDRINERALIESARNMLLWKSAKYELAREYIARAVENYGLSEELNFLMFNYCIRADKYQSVIEFKNEYQTGKKRKKKVDPFVYSELAGYLIDRNETVDVYKILERIKKQDKKYPNTYFQLARYFRKQNDLGQMDKAAGSTLYYLSNRDLITSADISMKILSENMKGLAHYEKGEIIESEKRYRTAIKQYEDSLERRIVEEDSKFGEIYSNMGDIFYYNANELDVAYIQYQKAEDNLYITSELSYKKGYIDYNRSRYQAALLEFAKAADRFSSNPNLIFATANTMLKRDDNFSAIGNYYHLIDILENQKDRIKGYDPIERPNHKYIVDSLVKAYNNIGVAQYKTFKETGEQKKYIKSLSSLQKATDYRDALTRDRKTLIGRNLKATDSKVNMREVLEEDNINSILYPSTKRDLTIFEELPKNLEVNGLGDQILKI